MLQLLTIYVASITCAWLSPRCRCRKETLAPLPCRLAARPSPGTSPRHEKRVGGTKPGDFAFFLYHEHAGPHYGSVEFYLRIEGAPLATGIAGFYDRAIDVGNFFDAKYLFEGAGRSWQWNDPENRRYRLLAQNLPPAFRAILVEVSDVEGRFGRFKVHYVPRERVTKEMALEAIDTGRRLETVEANLILWDAQRIVWRARFESIPGNVALRQEIDAFLPRVASAETRLLALNRQALERDVARIHDIRKLVDTAQATPAAIPLKSPGAPARSRRAGSR